jgi:UDP-3-O-[3-hydroxymyristoyl] N-acetylglucosamine deacetylase
VSQQHTIADAVVACGVALHSGEMVRAVLKPAEHNTGVVFSRTGHPDFITARVSSVVDTQLATTLGDGSVTIRTVEHLLSALRGIGVDNVRVEVDGPELPVLDGCSMEWVKLLHGVGLKQQASPRKVIHILAPIEVRDGSRWARLEPADGMQLDVTIDFEDVHVGRQRLCVDLTPECFVSDLAWARTFGFTKYVPVMQKMGLVQGGSLENALVFGPNGPMNPEGLRAPDEPVRHKVLDAVGDLALLGFPIEGRLVAECPGHGIIVALLREVEKQSGRWEVR